MSPPPKWHHVHIVRHSSTREDIDPADVAAPTHEQIHEDEMDALEKLMREPPLGIDPPGMMRAHWRPYS